MKMDTRRRAGELMEMADDRVLSYAYKIKNGKNAYFASYSKLPMHYGMRTHLTRAQYAVGSVRLQITI